MDYDDWMTLDELRDASLALKELLGQREAVEASGDDDSHMALLSGDDSGPIAFDLTRIWRAAIADTTGFEKPNRRRRMSPAWYVKAWPHLAEPTVTADGGHILATHRAAFDYVQKLDSRVLMAIHADVWKLMEARAKADPIGHAVSQAKAGPLGMMLARMLANPDDDEEFDAEVMERAKQRAAGLDDFKAETLVAEVRRALKDDPRIKPVYLDDDGNLNS
jgi:hypothetical protein